MKRACQVLVSLVLLALAVYLLDWNRLGVALKRVHALPFALAVALAEATVAVMDVRWERFVAAVAPASRIEHWRIYFYATFLNTFTPANLGGDVYRAVVLKPRAVGMIDIVVVLLRERLVGLLAYLAGFCILVLLSAVLQEKIPSFFLIALLPIVALLCAVYAIKFLAPWIRKQSSRGKLLGVAQIAFRLFDALSFGGTSSFWAAMLLSFAALAIWIAAVNVVATSLGLGLTLTMLGMVVILTELVRLVPISFQGIGVRELTFAFLAHLAGAEMETGFLVGTLAYLALSISLILSGAAAWMLSLCSAAGKISHSDKESNEWR